MDYKEKYEMALEGIQEILGSGEDSIKMSRLQLRLQGIFPELKESEDERIIKSIICALNHYYFANTVFDGFSRADMIAWLKKQGEQKSTDKVELMPTWSKEDERDLDVICDIIYNSCNAEDASRLIEWLKSLKDRVQPKQEWSEEDNQYLCGLIGLIEQSKAEIPITLKGKAADNCIDWLKSLRPQNKWRPSGEQMKALKEACDEHWEPDGLDPLYTLYQDLKKLIE